MFLVTDTQEERHANIWKFFENDPTVGVILAAIDFEWTVRRAVLALGQRPTKEIRESTLARCSGLQKYKDAWRTEVFPCHKRSLPQVVTCWKDLKTAFRLRHVLVHGVSGTTTAEYAFTHVNTMLTSSKNISQFSSGLGKDLFKRKIVRIRFRSCK